MIAFLRKKRREGKNMRWIAAHLGVPLGRAVAKAAGLRLILQVPRTEIRLERQPGEPEPIGAPFALLEDGRCRWISNETAGQWRMCGAPCGIAEAWCPHHRARVFVKAVQYG